MQVTASVQTATASQRLSTYMKSNHIAQGPNLGLEYHTLTPRPKSLAVGCRRCGLNRSLDLSFKGTNILQDSLWAKAQVLLCFSLLCFVLLCAVVFFCFDASTNSFYFTLLLQIVRAGKIVANALDGQWCLMRWWEEQRPQRDQWPMLRLMRNKDESYWLKGYNLDSKVWIWA